MHNYTKFFFSAMEIIKNYFLVTPVLFINHIPVSLKNVVHFRFGKRVMGSYEGMADLSCSLHFVFI